MSLRHLDSSGVSALSRAGGKISAGTGAAAWATAALCLGLPALAGAASHVGAKHAPAKPAPAPAAGEAAEEVVETVDLESGDGGAKPAGSGATGGGSSLMGEDYPRMDRILDHLTAKVVRHRTLETLIGHRNYQGALQRPFRDLLGFDGGSLKVNLGLRYGVLDIFDIGLARMNRTFERFTTWELDTKIQVFHQEQVGLDLALRLGLDIFESSSSTSSAALGQLLLARTLGDRALLGAGVLFSSNSSGAFKRDSDATTSTAMMVQGEVRLLESLSVAAEVTFNIAGFGEKWPVITYGPKFITNRHTFSIVVSNSQYTTADSLVTNTYRSNWRDWLLGFHITREI